MRSFIIGNRLAAAAAIVLFAVTLTLADIAPDPGFRHVPANLVLEAGSDLSDFRFFLVTRGGEVERITLAEGDRTVITADGRVGIKRFSEVIAVPNGDLSSISGDLSGPLLERLVKDGAFPNARAILSHSFRSTISVVEEPFFKHPVYRISVVSGNVTAELIEGSNKPSAAAAFSGIFWILVPIAAFAVLVTSGIAIIGIWFLRRRSRKAVSA